MTSFLLHNSSTHGSVSLTVRRQREGVNHEKPGNQFGSFTGGDREMNE